MRKFEFPMYWFLVLSLVLLGSAGCPESPPATPTPRSLVVIGVDGATWDVLDPMMERGELPNFQSLVDRGARGSLITLPPLVSPVAWTTYATGTFSRKHGILDFTYPYVPGEKHPVESTLRREPALWNAASQHGRSVGVVGYYVTHPAEVVNGFMVSDKILQLQPGTTYPPELESEVEVVPRLGRRALLRRFMPWGYDPRDAEDPESPDYNVSRVIRGRIDGAIIRDENVRRTTLKLLDRPVDVFLTYFRLVDHAEHATWRYFEPSAFDTPTPPEDVEKLSGMIPEAYRYTDEVLGEILAKVGPDTNVVVISDHGHGSATGKYVINVPELADRLSGNHRFDGILLAAGPDIQPGVYEGVNAMQVTPLLLALAGIPISQQLPGDLPEGILTPALYDHARSSTVDAYKKEWDTVSSTPADPEADQETLAELKALGYIDSSVESGGRGAAGAVDFWSIQPELRQNALLGELLFYLLEDDLDRAGRLMTVVKENDPALASRMPTIVKEHAAMLEDEFTEPPIVPATLSRFLAAHPPKQKS